MAPDMVSECCTCGTEELCMFISVGHGIPLETRGEVLGRGVLHVSARNMTPMMKQRLLKYLLPQCWHQDLSPDPSYAACDWAKRSSFSARVLPDGHGGFSESWGPCLGSLLSEP